MDESPGPGGGYIVVVDDDPTICEILQMTLEDDGWTVVTVQDGSNALDVIARRRPNVVIMDLNLRRPGEGRLLVETLARSNPPIPILVISGDSDLLSRTRDVHGITAYLPKPFDLDQLYATVHRLASGRTQPGNLRASTEFGPNPDSRWPRRDGPIAGSGPVPGDRAG